MGQPTRLIIETTTHCNSKCTMCPMGKIDRPSIMPMNDYCELIEGCQDFGIEEVSLTGYGEPLCDTYLEERVAYASVKLPKAKITVFTNGSLMNERRTIGFLNAGLTQVVFSVDGATKETYEKIRVGLNYETVVENICRFVKWNNDLENPCNVRVHMTLQPENAPEMGRFKNLWSSVVDEVTFNACDGRGGEGRSPFYDDYSMKPGCPIVETTLNVMADMRVVMCCQDWNVSYPLGNIAKDGILGAWNSAKFQALRQAHRAGRKREHPLCGKCHTRY